MIWCRTALKLGRIIRGTSQYRKSYLMFRVTRAVYLPILAQIAMDLGIW